MAKLTLGQKAERVLQFLVGLGNRRVRRALTVYAFTDADLDDGWKRLMALSRVSADGEEEVDPALLERLDAWENRWFGVAEVLLRIHFPDVHTYVFRNVRQGEGIEVVVSVSTLLRRLELVALPEEEGGMGELGSEACARLATRGLDDAVLDEARELLRQLASPQQAPPVDYDTLDREARAAAERHMWEWYLEWSTLARLAIRDRRLLRSLGFLRSEKKRKKQ